MIKRGTTKFEVPPGLKPRSVSDAVNPCLTRWRVAGIVAVGIEGPFWVSMPGIRQRPEVVYNDISQFRTIEPRQNDAPNDVRATF
jgi:hypothetical protein